MLVLHACLRQPDDVMACMFCIFLYKLMEHRDRGGMPFAGRTHQVLPSLLYPAASSAAAHLRASEFALVSINHISISYICTVLPSSTPRQSQNILTCRAYVKQMPQVISTLSTCHISCQAFKPMRDSASWLHHHDLIITVAPEQTIESLHA